MTKLCVRLLLASVLCALFASRAEAQSVTINVSATVAKTCNITTPTVTLAFGSYDPLNAHASTDLDLPASIKLRCTKGTVATVSISGTADRTMAGPNASTLSYALYSDAYANKWATGFSLPLTSTSMGTEVVFPVNGRIFRGQDVDQASYTDTVTATVSF